MWNPHRRQAFPSATRAALAASALAFMTSTASAQANPPGLPASQATAPTGPCVMIFGQGRNFDPSAPSSNRRWDEANGAFNLAAREPLGAAGLPVVNVVLPVAATDVPRNLQGLIAEVQRRGCTRVLETAIFADTQQGLLIARLRVYPVLGLLGPQAAGSQPRIGSVSYTQQKEFALDARVLERVNPSKLGRAMAEEALDALRPPARAQ